MKNVLTNYALTANNGNGGADILLLELSEVMFTRIMYIRNLTVGQDIYKAGDNPEDIVIAGSLVTFTGDTTGWEDTDQLLIIYDHTPFFSDLASAVKQTVITERLASSYNGDGIATISGGNTDSVIWQRLNTGPFVSRIHIRLWGGTGGDIKFYTNDGISLPNWGMDVPFKNWKTGEVFLNTAAFTTGGTTVFEIDVSNLSFVRMLTSSFVGGSLSYQVIEGVADSKQAGNKTARKLATGSNNATNIKATVGRVFAVNVFNNAGAARYIKLYNKATTPAPNTDIGATVLLAKIPVAAGQSLVLSFGQEGLVFPSGIGYAMVTGIADNDNTAVTASDVELTIIYQ